MDEPGGRRARGELSFIDAALERLSQLGVEDQPRSFGADDDFCHVAMRFGADIEPAAADERVARDQREVQENLDRGLAERRLGDMPAELGAAVAPEHSFDRALGLTRVDHLAEAARRAEGQAEELQLARRGARAFVQKVEAARAHVGIMFVGEQLEPVVERADRAQQVVAQARTEQAGKINGADRHLLS